jgi:hypothetical protein
MREINTISDLYRAGEDYLSEKKFYHAYLTLLLLFREGASSLKAFTGYDGSDDSEWYNAFSTDAASFVILKPIFGRDYGFKLYDTFTYLFLEMDRNGLQKQADMFFKDDINRYFTSKSNALWLYYSDMPYMKSWKKNIQESSVPEEYIEYMKVMGTCLEKYNYNKENIHEDK